MLNILTGFLSGIISGMGIGGGAILIPALVFFQNVSQKMAQGINLTYFIPTALISLWVHIKNKSVQLKTAGIIGGIGALGSIAGASIATAMDGDHLRRLFGFFLLFVGGYELYKGFRTK